MTPNPIRALHFIRSLIIFNSSFDGNVQEGISTVDLPVRDPEAVRVITEKCQRLVEQAAVGFITRAQFLNRFKESRAFADKANAYVEQLSQCLQDQQQSRDL